MKLAQSLRPLNLAKIFMLAFFATIVGVFVTYFDQSEKWTLNRFLFVGFTSFLVALLVQFVLDYFSGEPVLFMRADENKSLGESQETLEEFKEKIKEMVKNNNAPKRFDLKTILSHTFYLICMLPSYLNENYFMLSMMTLGFITILLSGSSPSLSATTSLLWANSMCTILLS